MLQLGSQTCASTVVVFDFVVYHFAAKLGLKRGTLDYHVPVETANEGLSNLELGAFLKLEMEFIVTIIHSK